MLPRHSVLPARDGIRLVAAEEHPARLGSAVDEIVGVPEAGHLARKLVAVDRCEGDVLVVDWDRRGERPNERRDLRRPDPARVDHALRLDPVSGGVNSAHLTPRAELDPRDARAGEEAYAELTGGCGERIGGGVRINGAVIRDPDRPVERVRRRGRHEADDIVGREDLDVETDCARPARAALELLEALGTGRDAQASDRLEDAQLAVELDAVAAEAHHRRRGVELRHETRRVAGGAARQLALLDEDGVRPTGFGEVIGDARAGDPTADDNDPRPLHAIETYAT